MFVSLKTQNLYNQCFNSQERTCLINGFCFNKDEASPLDYCAVCDPFENEYQFSTRKG